MDALRVAAAYIAVFVLAICGGVLLLPSRRKRKKRRRRSSESIVPWDGAIQADFSILEGPVTEGELDE
jgi:hypothetical protein